MANSEKVQKKQKKMTVGALKKIDKQWEDFEVVNLEIDGENYEIKVYQKIRPSIMQKMLVDLANKVAEVEDMSNADLAAFGSNYYVFLLVKYLTDFGNKLPNDLSKQLQLLEIMTDNGVLTEILKMIPDEEIEKITKKITDALKDAEDYKQNIADEILKVEIENEDVMQVKKWAEDMKKEVKH